ncbi:MAG TPA: APC family permease [Solirubrobacteraceae bacterium]|nr:APC family permease [Solirubrobacteraceae bacterium]
MSTATAPKESAPPPSSLRLRPNAVGFWALLAQSVALISPTMTAVLIIGLAFADSGQGTWAAYLFATVMLLFVVLGLNQFAKRSATAGSMYAYTARGLGPAAGVMSGWTLIWSYLFIATVGLAGFAIFAAQLMGSLGIHGTVTPVLWFAVSGALCGIIAWKDIRISSLLTLVFEALSVACILVLAFIVLFRHGFSVDTHALELKGVSLKGMDFAIVICIFSLVGFESATALGGEAKDATRTVPRAVVWSLLITGAFMVVMSYVEVFATQHGPALGSLATPLNSIAGAYNVPVFRGLVSIGAIISFFSLSLSCLNAGARIIFPLAGHGFLPKRVHAVHPTNLTPHMALAAYGAVILTVAVVLYATGWNALTLFGDAGTLAAFGFLTAYFLIAIASPLYLKKLGELRRRNVVIAVLGFACLLVPTVGSFYPAPPYPVNLFPYIFLAYALLGGGWLFILSRRQPGTLADIEASLERALEASVHAAVDERGDGLSIDQPPAPAFAPAGA